MGPNLPRIRRLYIVGERERKEDHESVLLEPASADVLDETDAHLDADSDDLDVVLLMMFFQDKYSDGERRRMGVIL